MSSDKITSFFKSNKPETISNNSNEEDVYCGDDSQVLIPIDLTGGNTTGKEKTSRVFKHTWAAEFPWLMKLSETQVKCEVCAKNRCDTKNDWASGKFISQWFKTTFSKHAASTKHKDNLLITPMQKSLVVAVEKAQSKAELQTIGLMCNILAAIQNELSLNKIDFLHNLTDYHLDRALHQINKQSSDATNDIAVSNALKISNKHRSLYSTYKIMKTLNQAVNKVETEKV